MKKYIKLFALTFITVYAFWLPLDLRRPTSDGIPRPISVTSHPAIKTSERGLKTGLDKVPVNPEDYVRIEARKHGWADGNEWDSLYQLISNESGWHQYSVNSSSGACGLFQALPCSKLGDSMDNVSNQARWGLGYIKDRYGSPSAALGFWNSQSPHWY